MNNVWVVTQGPEEEASMRFNREARTNDCIVVSVVRAADDSGIPITCDCCNTPFTSYDRLVIDPGNQYDGYFLYHMNDCGTKETAKE